MITASVAATAESTRRSAFHTRSNIPRSSAFQVWKYGVAVCKCLKRFINCKTQNICNNLSLKYKTWEIARWLLAILCCCKQNHFLFTSVKGRQPLAKRDGPNVARRTFRTLLQSQLYQPQNRKMFLFALQQHNVKTGRFRMADHRLPTLEVKDVTIVSGSGPLFLEISPGKRN